MSVIGKKPYVNKIIDACTSEQVSQIVSLMDNLGTPVEVALYGTQNLISEDNKGVSYVTLKIQDLTKIILNGILVYIDNDNCGFFGIASNSDNITEYRIDPVNKTFERLYEYLTIEEFRQVCGDALSGSGSGSSNVANIYTFQEGDELTTEIYDSLKNGDIVVVDNYPFVITKVEHTAEYEGDDDYVSVEGTYTINPESAMAAITKRIVWNSQPLNGNLFIENGRTYPNVFYFQNGDELTEEIYNQLQVGDMIVGANTNEVCTIARKDSQWETYSIQGYGIRSNQDNVLFSTLEWYSDDENGLTIIVASASGSGDSNKLYCHYVEVVYDVDTEQHPEEIWNVNFKVLLPTSTPLTEDDFSTSLDIRDFLQENYMYSEVTFWDGNDNMYILLGTNAGITNNMYLLKIDSSNQKSIVDDFTLEQTENIYFFSNQIGIAEVIDNSIYPQESSPKGGKSGDTTKKG